MSEINWFGQAPEVIATNVQLSARPEFMFVQELPVRMYKRWRIPENCRCFEPILNKVALSIPGSGLYVYLTAKHVYTEPGAYPNRPGWHGDGYGTDDVNYIWYDGTPTEFAIQDFGDLSSDHAASMRQMEERARPECVRAYPAYSLLRLTQHNIHRVARSIGGFRIFVKITVSQHKHNLCGNAHNYLFDYDWEMHDREEVRNNPFIKEAEWLSAS